MHVYIRQHYESQKDNITLGIITIMRNYSNGARGAIAIISSAIAIIYSVLHSPCMLFLMTCMEKQSFLMVFKEFSLMSPCVYLLCLLAIAVNNARVIHCKYLYFFYASIHLAANSHHFLTSVRILVEKFLLYIVTFIMGFSFIVECRQGVVETRDSTSWFADIL